MNLGEVFKDLILAGAGLLKASAAPGWISLIIVLVLVFCMYWVRRQYRQRRLAIKWLSEKLTRAGDDLCQEIDALTAELKREAGTNIQRLAVLEVWDKYRETLVVHEEDGQLSWRNSVRPAQFLNIPDMGFSLHGWRAAPGFFVSVGLFLTFLGLVSALDSMGGDEGITGQTMQTLLTIASAKFVMSLTGLFCSIVFSIWLKFFEGTLERSASSLSTEVEQRLRFISLEDLAHQQLQATVEQREHFRRIGMEMVAELGRPLREELPAAISTSISTAMGPLLEQVKQSSQESAGGFAKSLSEQFSGEVASAFAAVSRQLENAGEKMGQIADRLDNSSSRMGGEMEAAVASLAKAIDGLHGSMARTTAQVEATLESGAQKLLEAMSQSLDAIRLNTSEGALAINNAATAMSDAANKLSGDIGNAGARAQEILGQSVAGAAADAGKEITGVSHTVIEAIAKASGDITSNTSVMTDKFKEDIFGPMERMVQQLEALNLSLKSSSVEFSRLSDGVRSGAQASSQAAETFKDASTDLRSAIDPVRATTERIESSIRKLNESTDSATRLIKQSAETTVHSAAKAIEAASEMLGGQSKSVQLTLKQITEVLERLDGQGERLDDIDEKLGKAFDLFNRQVSTAIETLRSHVGDFQSTLTPALDTLHEIVEQAEKFMPQSRPGAR